MCRLMSMARNAIPPTETEGHRHSDGCYIQGETLLCQLGEMEGHTHGEECSESVLVCSETDEAHTHDENCYEFQITCTIPESEGHTHTADCYEKVLNCSLVEEDAHWHTDDCYEQLKVLVCQYAEGESGEGAETTVPAEPVLICTEPEILLHSHTEECYESDTGEDGTEGKILVCGKLAVAEHIHSDACFEVSEVSVDTESLTCQLTEEGHTHTAMCYGTWELVCEIPEHTHTEECQPASELAEEELAQVDAVIAQIDALESTEQVETNLAAYEEAEDWEGYAAYYEEAAQQTQAARESYAALSDVQKQKVTNVSKLNKLEWLVPLTTLESGNQGTILEKLDGDWAYITYLMMKADGTGLSTGTSPWDADDGAGNDSTAENKILRTFDTASYTIQFNTTLRDAVAQQDVGGIYQGRLYFEFILPVSAEEAQFETGSMGWLSNSQNIKYEVVTATVNVKTTVDGVETEVPTKCQVLRGSFTLTPTGSNDAAIGASTNELNIIIRALRMQNGDTIRPIFTLWLQHNNVGATYNTADDRLPASIVTGTNVVCDAEVTKKDGVVEKHDSCEAATLYGDEIVISARPMFNIALCGINSNNTTVGTFDFNVADAMNGALVDEVNANDMINYGLGEVYGRMNGYGIRIELRGKEGQGMRGCEFPDETTDIQITLAVTTLFTPSSGAEPDVSNYQALFWSGDANATRGDGGFNNDGRTIFTKKDYIHSTLPFNKKSTKGGKSYMRCYNGGNWYFEVTEDGKAGDSLVQVTVKDFQFNVSSIANFPYTYTSGTETSYNYYNPNTIPNYWEIEQAVFSTGELWLVQPYNGLPGTADEGEYIADKYGDGQFYTKVEITDLYLRSEGGQELDETTDQTQIIVNGKLKEGTVDDTVNNAQYLKTPGGIDGRVIYTVGEAHSLTQPLTDGCQQTDADWATAGTKITLTTWLFHSKAEAEYVGVAYDNLVKFDDEFFLPDTDENNATITGKKTDQRGIVLWAAKPDGTGWDSDEEMKAATPDDLVFYASLDALYADGKICIGAMAEIRGVGEESAENQLILHVDGTIRSDCEPGKVYMVTRSSYAWNKKNVAEQALAYHNVKYSDNKYDSSDSLSKVEWNEYLKDNVDGFPSHLNVDRGNLLTDDHLTVDTNGEWPKPFWRQDYYYCNVGNTTSNVQPDGTVAAMSESVLKKAYKASYENGVYTEGYGAYYYEDSCLVISFDTTVDKYTAQTEAESTVPKVYYDMGKNQRTVDYVVVPKLERKAGESSSAVAAMETIIYVEDTLPATLSYIPDSSYFGGTYTQDASHQNQGTCTGAVFETTGKAGTSTPNADHPYLITVTANDDGTTTIRWMIWAELAEGQTLWTDEIYFSAYISDAAANSTEDVKIDNTVKIWAEGETARPFSTANRNMAVYGIVIEKTTAVSLSKLSDQLVMDWWEDFGFTMSIGNNSGTAKNGTIIVETLPFDGLYRSDFTGRLVLKEFSAAVLDSESNLISHNFTYYYSTSEKYAGWRSGDYYDALNESGKSSMAEWIDSEIASGYAWEPLTMSDTTTTVNGLSLYSATLPSQETQEGWGKYSQDGNYQQITSIVAVGDLAKGATLKMHVTVCLPDGAAGDYMVNYVSQNNLSSYARAQAVNRSLEGLTWLDKDMDGIQDAGEETVEVWAVLYKRNNSGVYEQYHFQGDSEKPVVYVKTGQQISVMAESRVATQSYDPGRYKFTDLPAGTYAVLFKSTTGDGKSNFDISTFVASPCNVGDDDTVDSDASPHFSSTDSNVLNYTWIEGIVMKEAKDLVYGMDESKYHDSGFCYRSYELPETGGTGTTPYTVAGVALMLLSAVYLLYQHQKRRRETA